MRIFKILLAFLVFWSAGSAWAQDDFTQEYVIRTDSLARQNVDHRLKPLDFGLMGDSIDPYSGTLVFNVTDVALKGNSKLEVIFRRRARQHPRYLDISTIGQRKQQALADWVLDVPNISSINVDSPNYPMDYICNRMGDEREGDGVLGFNGYELNIPGKGAQKILGGAGASPHPNPFSPKEWGYGGEPDIAGVTPDHSVVSCIADIGAANGGGEGFIVTTADGTRYKLDRLIEVMVGTEPRPCVATLIPLKESRLVATEVVDVHGNWVKYDYASDGRLTRIYSNDGRQIDVTYHAGTSNIATVSANGRVWSYQYSDVVVGSFSTRVLSSVTQPDGRSWQYDIWPLTSAGGVSYTLSVTHPYGTVATYGLTQAQHYTRRWYSPGECGSVYAYRTRPDRNRAVANKTLSGPNIPTSTWQFSYGDLGTIEIDSSNEETLTKKNTVTNPNGTVAEAWYYIAGKRMGKASSSRTLAAAGGALIENVAFSYEVGTPLAPLAGMEFSQFVDSLKQPVLLSKRVITRGGDVFTTDTAYNSDGTQSNYSYGKPVLISSYSNLSSEVRTQAISYEHNKAKWILGLPDQVTRNGKLFDDLGYDSFGNVLTHDQFGVRRGTYTYHAGGTAAGMMASSKDGLNRTTYYNNWKRGAAQQVIRPDGVSLLATVDDNGWVTNQTDAKGNQTGFQYSSVGWMTKVDRPAPWQDTDITYTDVGGSNFHQTATRGTEETVVWYDTLHRPWNTRVRPLSGGGATTYTRIAYDTSGREAFRSFPSASANPADGTTLTYDGLGRALASAENVAPYATTNYAYLAGNKTQVIDPEGNSTTTTLRAYGEPGNGDIVQIAQPLGRFTDMTYDNYGNMLTATQYGNQNGFNVTNTHRYVYDSRLRLCRHSVPETGDTLYEYDNANQAVGVAKGQAAGTACAALPAAETIVSGYDDLGRVTSIDYPGTAPDIGLTYDNNGKVTRNLRGTADWRYAYDNADQLTEEKLLIDGRTYTTGYEYNALGARAYQTFPSGRRVDFAPNGLGQATKAEHVGGTAYASGMTYHANGTIDTINYGNGFVHNTTFNNRQLLASIHVRSGATTAVQLAYGHDLNSRVTSITDSAVAGQNRAFTYDGLSRVLTASGPWGSGSYTYDALDNLRQTVSGARIVNVEYDGANRVLRTQDSANGNSWRDYSHDGRGNVIGNGTIGFTYDLSNQPIALTGPALSGAFVYDGNLKRAKQVMGGKTIYSVYSASGALLHRDDATTGTTTDYVAAAGKTIARVKGTEVTYMHQDHLGSPVAATNAAGAVAWREDFTPYGEKRLDPFANKDDEGFTGHIADTATGLTYMQARYYDPIIGRFLSDDPIGFDVKNPWSFNRYVYASNDPVNRADPTGKRDIYIGGAADKDQTRIVQDYAARQQKLHPDRDIQYFSYSEWKEVISAASAPLQKGEPLNIIGHSLGGALAIKVAVARSELAITNLISIDPVSAAGTGSKPDNVEVWANVRAVPSNHNRSDTIASIGNFVFGKANTTGTDISLDSPASHGDFATMMSQINALKAIEESYRDIQEVCGEDETC